MRALGISLAVLGLIAGGCASAKESVAGGVEIRVDVGETPLTPGRYTYALNIDPDDRQLTIDLVED